MGVRRYVYDTVDLLCRSVATDIGKRHAITKATLTPCLKTRNLLLVTCFHVGIIVRANRWIFCSGYKLQQEIMIVSLVTNRVPTFTRHN